MVLPVGQVLLKRARAKGAGGAPDALNDLAPWFWGATPVGGRRGDLPYPLPGGRRGCGGGERPAGLAGTSGEDAGMSEHLVAVPILPVRDMAEAVEFWSRLPHLEVEEYGGGGYAFVRHLDAEVIHLDHRPELNRLDNMAGCYLHVPGIDALRATLASAGMQVSEVRDEPWGMREFTLTDPDGNTIRLGCGD